MTTQYKELFDDLLAIEVDLVVSDEVAPDTPDSGSLEAERLIDELTRTYRTYVDEHTRALDAAWRSWFARGDLVSIAREDPSRLGTLVRDGVPLAGFESDTSSDGLVRVGRDAMLGEAMAKALAAAGRPSDLGVVNVMRRIWGNVDQLNRTTGGERMRIARKAWELGSDRIVAQTVVQLDGDVVQRVAPLMLGASALRDVHQTGVANATGQWRQLVELFVNVTVGAVGLVRSLFRGSQALRTWRGQRRAIVAMSERTSRQLWKPTEIRATWGALRRTITSLFADGGATITTPSGAGARPYARTVVQPDGDSIWLVARHAIERRSDLDAHAEAVSRWYAETGRVAATVQRYAAGVQAVIAGLLASVGLVVGLLRHEWIPIAAGVVLPMLLVPLVRFVIRLIVRRRIRGLLS